MKFIDDCYGLCQVNYMLTLGASEVGEKENYIFKNGDWFDFIDMLEK
ncbi:conserved hypothetical protein [Halomonas sp. 59]|jgi:hypothetical protein|nr:conserved hypothetical protein [Halomonas sp. 156]CAD5287482.1 conserved hypothetical protein [Halomonas sp. 113]CAD5289019.1 conserved hypothetical protein [Halomonas sp. 59]CAD5292018.1 hypothetical protein HALOI3_60063 [Halomonas sp. I3]VXB41542.1 conserved hypothetical protein [Halomonas titanicae]